MSQPKRSRVFPVVSFILPLLALGAACTQQPPPSEESAPAAETSAASPADTAPAEPPAPSVPEPQSPAAAPAKPAASRPVAPPTAPKPVSPAPAPQPAQQVAEVPREQPPDVAPAPEPIIKTVPAGAEIDVVFLDGLSSETSTVGDSFRARVAQDVTQDGVVVIPAGSVVVGTVTEVAALKKIGGTAKLALEFNKLELTSGRSALIDASLAQEGKSETKKDAATIGGAAAGGAVLGRVLTKKNKGAVLGAIVGAAAGTAIAAKSQGEKVEIPVGTELTLSLNRPAQITLRP